MELGTASFNNSGTPKVFWIIFVGSVGSGTFVRSTGPPAAGAAKDDNHPKFQVTRCNQVLQRLLFFENELSL